MVHPSRPCSSESAAVWPPTLTVAVEAPTGRPDNSSSSATSAAYESSSSVDNVSVATPSARALGCSRYPKNATGDLVPTNTSGAAVDNAATASSGKYGNRPNSARSPPRSSRTAVVPVNARPPVRRQIRSSIVRQRVSSASPPMRNTGRASFARKLAATASTALSAGRERAVWQEVTASGIAS